MLNASNECLLQRQAEEAERPLALDYGSTRREGQGSPAQRPGQPLATHAKGCPTPAEASDHRSLLDKLACWLRSDAKSLKELLGRLASFFVGSVLWSFILVATLVIPLVMLVVGGAYLQECPRQPLVPVFLLVGGVTSALNNVLNLVQRFRRLGDASPPRTLFTPLGVATSLLNCFALAWLLAGCVWVYGSYRPSYSVGAGSLYCHPGAYLLAFWLLNGCGLFLLALALTAAASFGWRIYFAGHIGAADV